MLQNTLIGIGYSAVGIVAYGMTIAATIKLRKKINSPAFLPLYFIAAAVDLLTHINTWIMFRLRFEPAFFFYFEWIILPEMGILRNFQFFLINFYYFDQNACVFLLMLNRYTVIFHPDHHEWLWKTYKWVIIGAVHFCAFAICLGARMACNSNVTFVFNDSAEGFEVRGDSIEDSKPLMLGMICYGAIMLVACSLMNLRLLCRLVSFKHSNLEYSLTVLTLLTFAAQAANIFLVIITSTCIFREDWESLKPFSPLVPIFSDLFSLGPAVYTMLAPGPISSFYFEKIRDYIRRKRDDFIGFYRSNNQTDTVA